MIKDECYNLPQTKWLSNMSKAMEEKLQNYSTIKIFNYNKSYIL
jgi:hypothetical protein